MIQRKLRYGTKLYDDKIYENMIGSVIEQTRGANIRFSPFIGTYFGFTTYQSEYNRALDPQIINTITASADDDNPELDADDYDD